MKARITDIKSNRWGQKHIFINGKKYLLDKFKGKFNVDIITPKGKRVPRAVIKGMMEDIDNLFKPMSSPEQKDIDKRMEPYEAIGIDLSKDQNNAAELKKFIEGLGFTLEYDYSDTWWFIKKGQKLNWKTYQQEIIVKLKEMKSYGGKRTKTELDWRVDQTDLADVISVKFYIAGSEQLLRSPIIMTWGRGKRIVKEGIFKPMSKPEQDTVDQQFDHVVSIKLLKRKHTSLEFGDMKKIRQFVKDQGWKYNNNLDELWLEYKKVVPKEMANRTATDMVDKIRKKIGELDYTTSGWGTHTILVLPNGNAECQVWLKKEKKKLTEDIFKPMHGKELTDVKKTGEEKIYAAVENDFQHVAARPLSDIIWDVYDRSEEKVGRLYEKIFARIEQYLGPVVKEVEEENASELCKWLPEELDYVWKGGFVLKDRLTCYLEIIKVKDYHLAILTATDEMTRHGGDFTTFYSNIGKNVYKKA